MCDLILRSWTDPLLVCLTSSEIIFYKLIKYSWWNWLGSLIVSSFQGTEPPLEGAAGLLSETAWGIFFFRKACWQIWIRSDLNEVVIKRQTTREEKQIIKNTFGQVFLEGVKIEQSKWTKRRRRQEYTLCSGACPWINLVQNVRIEFPLGIKRIN